MAAEEFIEAAFSADLKWPVRRFACRATRWAVTSEHCEIYALRSVTHIGSGKKFAGDLSPRAARAVAVILDRILPCASENEVMAAFLALPQPIRVWILSWRKGAKR